MAFLRNFVVNANTGIVAGEDEILLSLLPLQTRVLVLAFPPFFKILRMLTLAKNFLPVDIISAYRKWVLVIVQSHVIWILHCFYHRCFGCAFLQNFHYCMCGIEGIAYLKINSAIASITSCFAYQPLRVFSGETAVQVCRFLTRSVSAVLWLWEVAARSGRPPLTRRLARRRPARRAGCSDARGRRSRGGSGRPRRSCAFGAVSTRSRWGRVVTLSSGVSSWGFHSFSSYVQASPAPFNEVISVCGMSSG